MSYEDTRKFEQELRAAFAAVFPLASERDLPWAACHISGFLKKRIEHEVAEQTRHFTSRVVRVLCEVSPPKTYVDDMARIVVDKAKRSETLLELLRWFLKPDEPIGSDAELIRKFTDKAKAALAAGE